MMNQKARLASIATLANAIALVTSTVRSQAGQSVKVPEESSGHLEELVAAKLQARLLKGVKRA